MLHPLLPFRLFCQLAGPLRRPAAKPHRPVRAWLWRTLSGNYRRWGTPVGLLLGLYLSIRVLAPIVMRG